MEKIELDNLVKLIDEFVASLKKDLLSVEVPAKGILPGVWDKMKSWWHNLTKKKGPNDPENPYLYKNKFGALGQTQESNRLSLSQYSFIKECYQDLENNLNILSEETALDSDNIKKLKLFKIIDSWADKFKKAVINQFGFKTSAIQPPEASSAQPKEPEVETEVEGENADSGSRAKIEDIPVGRTAAPAKRDSGDAEPAVPPQDRPGAGRPGRGLVINWYGGSKNRFVVRKSVNGVSKLLVVDTDGLLPISVLGQKNDSEIQKLESSAENHLKVVVYKKLLTQMPGTNRAITGLDEHPMTFDIDKELFDEKFKEAFKEVLETTSKEYEKIYKDDKATKGDKIHKEILSKVYEKLDVVFKDRSKDFHIDDVEKLLSMNVDSIEE